MGSPTKLLIDVFVGGMMIGAGLKVAINSTLYDINYLAYAGIDYNRR